MQNLLDLKKTYQGWGKHGEAPLQEVEKQIAANQSATELRIEQFEENLTHLWELEEQLAQAEFRERLALLQANQEEIADALHTAGRNLTFLSVVVSTALVAALLGLLFLL